MSILTPEMIERLERAARWDPDDLEEAVYGRAPLSLDAVRAIRESPLSCAEAGLYFGIGKKAVGLIRRRLRHKDVP